LVDNNRILVTGGITIGETPINAGELYSGTWTPTTEMLTPRVGHTAVPTDNSGKRVLLLGGDNGQGPTNLVELCDVVIFPPKCGLAPQLPNSAIMPNMGNAHAYHTFIRDEGRMFVFGGYPEAQSVEMYDTMMNKWVFLDNMKAPRAFFAMSPVSHLPGKVLLSGGLGIGGTPQASAEIFDLISRKFVADPATPDMSVARARHTSATLSDGRVLVIGGSAVEEAEILHCSNDTECPTDLYCAKDGICTVKKAQGTQCAAALDCWPGNECDMCQTGNCVDGYCCNDACNGQCEACDGNSSGNIPGICSPISGAPHGKRAACISDLDDQMAPKCKGKCDGFTREACEYPLGKPCGQKCADAIVSSLACSEFGACDFPTLEVSCSPFQCAADGKTCATGGCTKESECGEGFACNTDSGICVAKAGTKKCDKSEGSEELDILVSTINGEPENCAPFKCVNDACEVVCTTAYDCLSGNVCNPEGKCVKPEFNGTVESSISCSTSSSSNSSRFGWMFALAAAAVAARRNRARA
jgi:MYXO-CTERM domain-containing protein